MSTPLFLRRLGAGAVAHQRQRHLCPRRDHATLLQAHRVVPDHTSVRREDCLRTHAPLQPS